LGAYFFNKGIKAQHLKVLERQLAAGPKSPLPFFYAGLASHRAGDPVKALCYYQQAIDIDPNMLVAHNNIGNIFDDLGRFAEAIEAFNKVLEIDPDHVQGHYNIGSAYRLIENNEAAIIHLSKAIRLNPRYSQAWNNLALTCKNMGDYDRALKYFDRALQIDPNFSSARWNRAQIYLLEKIWQPGWRDFEARFNLPHWRAFYPYQLKGQRWDGRFIRNQTLFVHDEQGLGDTFQFVRWLPWVKERCDRLVFETRTEIISLLDKSLGIDEIVGRPDKGPTKMPFGQYIPLMSIPRLINLSPDRMPSWKPYIKASENKIAQWRPRLPTGTLKVGLVWAGRPEHGNDANRSCRIEVLSPLLRHEAIQFIGLQKGKTQIDDRFSQYPNFLNLGSQLDNFSDTAAILDQLDLLISVDTSVAHLAGAMGKPVWVLIPFIPDWRWGTKGSRSLWYPTMRLFRQPRPKDWKSVVADIDQELLCLMAKRRFLPLI